MLEFDLERPVRQIAEKLLSDSPEIIGMGVYIWNLPLATRVADIVRAVKPETYIVLGGPEVGYDPGRLWISRLADVIISGEAELEFPRLCKKMLADSRGSQVGYPPQSERIAPTIQSQPLDLSQMELPYDYYDAEDVAQRVIYVESSRGCPYQCEYCLSSLDKSVRYIDLKRLFPAFQELLDRGVLAFKFVDRTFNLDLPRCLQIIDFFLQHYRAGLRLHFEMVPDCLPADLRKIIAACPAGMFHFEVGVQTFNREVAARIKRPLKGTQIEENLAWLSRQPSADIHADLIAGLPGETLKSFARGFDRLLALNPDEIQVGVLKKLSGTSLARHDQEWGMRYSLHPPYEILQTNAISFSTMERVERFARFWEIVVNRNRFPQSAPLIWRDADSAFEAFLRWSDWLYSKTDSTGGISLLRLAKYLLQFLTDECGLPAEEVISALARDYSEGGRRSLPAFLRLED